MTHSDHPVSIMLRESVTIIGDAHVSGRIYDLGEYPGYKHSQSETDLVYGQLLLLRTDETLWILDEYEDVPDLYQRILVDCQCYDHRVKAWIYAYQGKVSSNDLIHSGRYTL